MLAGLKKTFDVYIRSASFKINCVLSCSPLNGLCCVAACRAGSFEQRENPFHNHILSMKYGQELRRFFSPSFHLFPPRLPLDVLSFF